MAENEVWCLAPKSFLTIDKDMCLPLLATQYKDPPIIFLDKRESYAMTTEMTPKVGKEIAPTLRGRDYKDPQIVFHDKAMFWNGDDVVGTLTVNNANGAQRMPDKANFGCILVEVGDDCAE